MHRKTFTMHTCTYLAADCVPISNSFRVKAQTQWLAWFRIVCMPKLVLLKSNCNQNGKNKWIDFLFSVTLHVEVLPTVWWEQRGKSKVQSKSKRFWHLHSLYTVQYTESPFNVIQSAIHSHASHGFNRYRNFRFDAIKCICALKHWCANACTHWRVADKITVRRSGEQTYFTV